ncbi:MAG: hypothetical protein DA328_06855 [Nitrososphaeraceae archaeon]|nr:hypothetical protein [Nitrososphaeraceae archaeon]
MDLSNIDSKRINIIKKHMLKQKTEYKPQRTKNAKIPHVKVYMPKLKLIEFKKAIAKRYNLTYDDLLDNPLSATKELKKS